MAEEEQDVELNKWLEPLELAFQKCRNSNDWSELQNLSEHLVADQTLAPNYQAYALTYRGIAKSNSGDPVGAFNDYNTAIQIRNDFAWGYKVSGDLHLAIGNPPQALEFYNQAIQHEASARPTEIVEFYLQRSQVKQITGDIPGALMDANKSVQLDGTNGGALNHRAILKLISNDRLGAEEDFNKALSCFPENSREKAEAYGNLASIDQEKSQFTEAISKLTKAIENDRKNANWLTRRGQIYQIISDLNNARNDFQAALNIDPNFLPAHQGNLTLQSIELSQSSFENVQKQIVEPAKLGEIYEPIINDAKTALENLKKSEKSARESLMLLLPLFWFLAILFIISLPIDQFSPTEDGSKYIQGFTFSLVVLSTTLTATFLSSPLIWIIRRNHHEQKIERLAIEDYIRKQLLISFVGGHLTFDGNRDYLLKTAISHLDRSGTAEQMKKPKRKRGKSSRTWFAWQKAPLNMVSDKKLSKRLKKLEKTVAHLTKQNPADSADGV